MKFNGRKLNLRHDETPKFFANGTSPMKIPRVCNGLRNRRPPLGKKPWTYRTHPANMVRLYPGARAKEKAKTVGWRYRQRGSKPAERSTPQNAGKVKREFL
jgi:hypothetical protein